MIDRRRLRPGLILTITVSLWSTLGIAQDGGPPRTTPEGLERTDGRFQALYWRPGATLGQYERIVILDCLVQFSENWLDDQNRGKLSLDRVTDEDMARIGELVAAEFRELFTEALTDDQGYEIVNVAAEDVLLLRPAVVNLDIAAGILGARSASPDVGGLAMTLYLEFYDSATSTLIGRALDARTRPETSRAAVRRVIGRWARDARTTIEAGLDADD